MLWKAYGIVNKSCSFKPNRLLTGLTLFFYELSLYIFLYSCRCTVKPVYGFDGFGPRYINAPERDTPTTRSIADGEAHELAWRILVFTVVLRSLDWDSQNSCSVQASKLTLSYYICFICVADLPKSQVPGWDTNWNPWWSGTQVLHGEDDNLKSLYLTEYREI